MVKFGCVIMKDIVPLVDKTDKIIGYKLRSELTKSDIHRVSALWITNSQGNILLVQRSLTKRSNPGLWGPAVSGTVEKGETYSKNIIKEAYEELGLKNIKPKKVQKIKVLDLNHFTQWYLLNIDMDISKFKLAKEEIAAIKWFGKDELKIALKNHPEQFLPKMKMYVDLFSKL